MYKQLFVLLFRLITEPAKTWERLSEKWEDNNDDFYRNYLYPVYGLIALCAFIGALFSVKEFAVAMALKSVIKQLIIYVGSFYLLSFLISNYLMPYFGQERQKKHVERFVAYASSTVYVVTMAQLLLGGLPFLRIAVLYTFYQTWTASPVYMNIDESQQTKFTLFSGALLLLVPELIGLVLRVLMPGI